MQLRQENGHLKERTSDLLKQIEFFQQNSDLAHKEKERKRCEQREEQARRELEHVKREKERLVDSNSEIVIALKQATEELRKAEEEVDRLRERVNFYEKTFPLTLTKHKRQLNMVSQPLLINSEPTQHNERQTPEVSTANTAKRNNNIGGYHEIMQELRAREQERMSEKSVQLHNMRMKINQDSMHSSIGTGGVNNSRKHLSEVAL